MHIIIICPPHTPLFVFVWVAGERPGLGRLVPQRTFLGPLTFLRTLPVLPQERLAVPNSLVTNILAVVVRYLVVDLSSVE
jgi:hypothetical protein